MARLVDASIVRLNPWWNDPLWEQRDPHLVALSDSPVELGLETFSSRLALDQPAIQIVRGPRQVGKSTALKRLVRRAVEELGRDAVVYLTFDELRDASISDVADTVRAAKRLASGDERAAGLVVLDEMTAAGGWADAVKTLWDEGTLRASVVVCTGSSAVDLREDAVERLPGRRGPGRNELMLPASFAAFAAACDERVPASPALDIRGLVSADGVGLLARASRLLPLLDAQLERFLRFGGLPAAVREACSDAAAPSAATSRVLWDALAREVQRRGASDVAFRALLERVALALGSKTNWSTLGRELGGIRLGARSGRHADHPSGQTVQAYVELLAACYALMVVYFWKPNLGASDQARDKKLYFADPLLHSIVLERAPGIAFDKPAAVENAVAIALYRRYEPTETQEVGMAEPQRVHVWQTMRGGEIDFVCGPYGAVEAAEVKYREAVSGRDVLSLTRGLPGRPAVVVTKGTLDLTPKYAAVPAALFLWALG